MCVSRFLVKVGLHGCVVSPWFNLFMDIMVMGINTRVLRDKEKSMVFLGWWRHGR